MNPRGKTLVARFDRLLSPVVAYRNFSLAAQNQLLLAEIRRRQNLLFSLILLLRNVLQWSVAVSLTPIAAILRFTGIRFLMVDLTQIGSVMWLDLYLRESRLSESTRKKILVCRSRYSDANAFVLDLYAPYVTYIFNPVQKFLLSPFFVNPWFRDDAFRYDAPFVRGPQYGERGSFGYSVCATYNRRFGRPLVEIPPAVQRQAKESLSELLPPGARFVAVHVRDAGYYGDLHRTTRNADIRTYEPAFRYLISLGYTVVRLGDPNMVRIDDVIERCGPQLIDYAHSSLKSEMLDIYLVAACELFVGSNSGMLALPIILNKNSCFVNFYNASTCLGYLEGDLTTFKKIRRHADGSLVPFEDLLRPPLSENLQRTDLEALGLYLEDNSSAEILDTLREYFERPDRTPTERQRRAKAMIPAARHSYQAAGDYSETILKLYLPETVRAYRAGEVV